MKYVYIVTRRSDFFDYAEVIYGVFTKEKKAEEAIQLYMNFNKDARTNYTIKKEELR